MEREIIKLPIKVIVLFASIVVLFFAFAIFLENKRVKKYTEANFKTYIARTLVSVENECWSSRGTLFYRTNHSISMSCLLIENDNGFSNWLHNGPVIDFDTIPHKYTIGDLGFPYYIFKKANNDTIIVEKEEYILKFLMDFEFY